MKQHIGNHVLDLLTGDEMRKHLREAFHVNMLEKYRGESYPSFTGLGNGTATVQLPGTPNGYAWNIRSVSVQCSAVANISVYPGENVNVAPIAVGVTQVNGGANEAVITLPRNVVVLTDQRVLTVVASAGTITNWRMAVKEVVAEMIGKL